jgi:hypothetical protein
MRTQYILDSAASLLGVALLIATAVHITGKASQTFADELSFGSAFLFLACCLLSHRAISKGDLRFEQFADKLFATGMLLLLIAVLSFWF